MPYVIEPTSFHYEDEDYDYKDRYPIDVDLSPQSEKHQFIINEVNRRARESREVMQRRYDHWRELDRTLTAYVDLTSEEEEIRSEDKRKPLSIVVPISYATLETLLTYNVAAFLNPPVFRYAPVESSDIIKVALLEHHINKQVNMGKMGLGLYTAWRDSYVYGFGVVAPRWVKKYAYRTIRKENTIFSNLLRRFVKVGSEEERVRVVIYEGNVLDNIDPYKAFPDPSVSIHKVQEMEFFGFLEETNYVDLLSRERYDNTIFNVRYLSKQSSFLSHEFNEDESGRQDRYGKVPRYQSASRPIDVIWMFIRIIPKEWGLGDGEYPEWWKFGVAGDKVLISASPTNLDHDMLPIAVTAPTFDGYSITPVSSLEVIYPLQHAMDWFISSHITNVRKALNDMIVVDPFLVNVNDLKDPEPGKIIRLRRAAWGRGVNDAVKQLAVVDVTKSHIEDVMFFMDIAQRTSGATDILQGLMRKTSERITAAEVQGSMRSALSRLEKMAKISSIQMMHDLAYMLASHTIQLVSEKSWVSTVGRYKEELEAEYGRTSVEVNPEDIQVEFDIEPYDEISPGGENIVAMTQAFQAIMANSELAQNFDVVRIFEHLAKASGFKSVHEFARKQPVETRTEPFEKIQEEARKGNIVPVNELGEGELT